MAQPSRSTSDPAARLVAPQAEALRRASALAVLANLLWIPQAFAIAAGIAGLLTPPAVLSPSAAALVFLALGVVRIALQHRAEGVLFRASDRLIAGLRACILTREAREGPGATAAGATAALAVEKLDMLAPFITRYAPARARVMVVPLVILALAFWIGWAAGLILLITGPLIPLFMALVGMAAQQASEKQMVEIGSLSDLLVDRLGALPDMRLLNAAPVLTDGFANRADALRARTMAVLRIAFLSSTVLELFAAIGVAMMAVFLGFSLLGAISFGTWGAPFTPFQVIFLLILTPEFYQPLRDLAAAWHDRAGARAVAAEITAWEDTPRSPALGTGAKAAPLPGDLSLALSGVVLRRGDHRIALPDFSLSRGESLALTGPSGAGKTSALLAIAGLIRPEQGRILVCGTALDDTAADAWRARLGWMPQAPHFLDRSLRENVGFDPEARIDTALAQAQAAHVVAALPQGADTRLGETGAGLSGGEARRVTLARAIQAAPDLLIADEPTADLDAATAAQVTQALVGLAARGTALIVATHDSTLAARMDRRIEIGAAS